MEKRSLAHKEESRKQNEWNGEGSQSNEPWGLIIREYADQRYWRGFKFSSLNFFPGLDKMATTKKHTFREGRKS